MVQLDLARIEGFHAISFHPNTVPKVPPLKTVSDAQIYLSMPAAREDRRYAYAIIAAFVEPKVGLAAIGRKGTKAEVGRQLESLEVQFPHFAPQFTSVRKFFKLPPTSVIFPPPPIERATSSGTAAGVIREEGHDAGLPAYAAIDPEGRPPSFCSTREY
ncbi:uncharacterized protein LOC62_01G001084 [Vanrija pseudolonga]|uniref:Uncharacterized protein n=1 Tax=Vanrija pseudolonga TaxID=143232 RepID=A0AAF1BHF7_9TREE|nr:hypothetical protein LOC62_01G001084 [Vanrija pseudolonga]